MPLTQDWYQRAQEVLGRKGVFTFNGRTAWDQAGLDIIVSAEGGLEGDAEGTIVGGHGAELFLPRVEVSTEVLRAEIDGLKAQADGLQKEREAFEAEKAQLEADRESLKTERLAFESLKAAWVGQKSQEPVSYRVICSQEELEGMEHSELGRLCSVWGVGAPPKKADRIAAILEAQEKHQPGEGEQKEGDSSEGA